MHTKAGWSQMEITPPLGLPMGGRGPRFAPGAEVLDPLWAQALILQDREENRTLWVSMDLVTVGHDWSDRLRFELSALTGIPIEAIILNLSHTHSGPMCGFESYSTLRTAPPELAAYEAQLHEKILRLVLEAGEKLRPAAVRLHHGRSEIGINRRRLDENGNTVMGPNPEGTFVPDLWVFDIEADSRALVFNHGCHPVTVYGYAWDGISADFPGACRSHLRRSLGKEVHCQFIQGLAGNVRPRLLADFEQGCFRQSKEGDWIRIGKQLARDVMAALKQPGETLELGLAAAETYFYVPRDVGRIPPLDHWRELSVSDSEVERELGCYWLRRLEGGLPPARKVPWRAGLLRLNQNHRIAWINGEVLAEWQALLRDWLEDPGLIIWGYCQTGSGYLPTDELLPQGGYEVERSAKFRKLGPGPFATGINAATRHAFEKLNKLV